MIFQNNRYIKIYQNISQKRYKFHSILILATIWLLSTLCDRLWFTWDNSVPSWDQADYLTGTLNYLQALQSPEIFNGEWWQSLWLLSSKIPPFTYILTAGIQSIFGTGFDQAAIVNLLFNGVLLGSVYGLGKILFTESVGLWAAALCQIMPALYRYRLDFLLDFPLTAVVTLTFLCLTGWYFSSYQTQNIKPQNIKPQNIKLENIQPQNSTQPKTKRENSQNLPSLIWAIAFGLSFGVALMVKQTTLIFLLIPILWVGITSLIKRRFVRLFQLLLGFFISTIIFGWWYRTNWLIILTSGKRATVDSAIAEGDAPLNTLAAWTFYFQQIPYQVSLPLLIVPIGILLFWLFSKRKSKNIEEPISNYQLPVTKSLRWLFIFLLGSYLLSSVNPNKDDRYVLPYLPIISILLSYAFTRIHSLWAQRLRWGSFVLATILMLFNLFPIAGTPGNLLTQTLSPKIQHHPYSGEKYPHPAIINQIITTELYLRSTLGVLPSTPEINQHNLNYYGALQNFQVYGRQVGTKERFVEKDARSLVWFLTKTNNQGSIPPSQAAIVKNIETSGNFSLNQTWKLPDNSSIKLYHQKFPPVEVTKIKNQNNNENNEVTNEKTPRISLVQVKVPEKAPPGFPIPVTYQWKGSAKALKNGLVLLTWENSNKQNLSRESTWLHDHGIAMGNLHSSFANQPGLFQVTETMGMLPPEDTIPGSYKLQATYLNRVTKETYSIPVPIINLNIDKQAKSISAPELDLLTQIRTLGATMPEGIKALDKVFDEVGRINQYDPNQDYLVQAREALQYRLEKLRKLDNLEKNISNNSLNSNLNTKLDTKLNTKLNTNSNLIKQKNWLYTLALTNVLQRHAEDAIQSLQKVTRIDSKNPYAYAYLAFVQLYNLQPKAAEKSLKPVFKNNNEKLNIPVEIKALDGIAALMQGNLIKAWQVISSLDLF
ncbi:MAG: glycosyltransferase family 39 protein [Cyanobacteria bacterium P01_A01_bin.45]